jgi:hypothetical protein
MSGVMIVGVLPTEMLAISLALANYGTLENSTPSSKEMQMCTGNSSLTVRNKFIRDTYK